MILIGLVQYMKSQYKLRFEFFLTCNKFIIASLNKWRIMQMRFLGEICIRKSTKNQIIFRCRKS